ncbi:hypothetical protein Klosneuvirus_5_42 [Klosneuvirus KNV1]|uniref:Uncharacterized protein n=1 Tax=Klosneuvirus KNV1 TaxID=1977640 RepID=A0A1V0SKX8_9VIRU|nr:hypothetical protein Klosneuvirus_5_42 [Klosneuvirus KNV1]
MFIYLYYNRRYLKKLIKIIHKNIIVLFIKNHNEQEYCFY